MAAPSVSGTAADAVDLRAWKAEGDLAHGVWEPSADGASVVQRLAGESTFFVSPDVHINTTLRGRFRVTGSGLGFVGFVLGYRSPLASDNSDPQDLDTLLIDWRARGATRGDAAVEGLTLSRLAGRIEDPRATLGSHAASPALNVLAAHRGAGKGWKTGEEHGFEVSYRRTRLKVSVDGQPVFDEAGTFPAGRIGLYTNGPSDARFSGVTAHASNAAPVANAGPDQTVPAGAGCQTSVALDGNGSTDPDGDALTYTWTGPFGTVSGVRPTVTLPPGIHTITLRVDDGNGAAAEDTVDVIVQDVTLPTLACPAAVKITTPAGQCQAGGVALGTPTSADNCGVTSTTNDAPDVFVHGTTQVHWSASDAAQNLAACAQTVAVDDATAPQVTAGTALSSLWPPNHAMMDVGFTASASDTCGDQPALAVTVSSDEPNDDSGDGNSTPDAQVDPDKVWLRSERKGNGDGRVYLLLTTATDPAGNVGRACRTVVVTHSQSKKDVDSVNAQAKAARDYCAANGAAPPAFLLLAQGPFGTTNHAPGVNAGPDQSITLPANTVTLNGTATDDGLPAGSTLTVSWTTVSGPGTVSFGNAASAVSTATFSQAGSYVLRLTASDGQLSVSDDVAVAVAQPNQPPTVNAGPDQSITLPANSVTLNGTVSDDGFPAGSALAISWTKVSGPGPVTFGSPTSAVTTASFTQAGTYVLRLSASDGASSASDDVAVTVIRQNLAPVADAGPDQTVALLDNLLQNPSGDLPLAGGEVPGWTEVVGTSWTEATGGAGAFPPSLEGPGFFFAGDVDAGELRQDVDVSALAASIAAGTQSFEFRGYVRATDETPPGTSRLVVEYRDAANQIVLNSFDSGPLTSVADWTRIADTRSAPVATRVVRVRLLSTRRSPAASNGYFDALSLRALPGPSPVTLTLRGSVTDDGLPTSTVTSSWSQVSGPAPVTFGTPAQPVTTATFSQLGTYVLRLAGDDSLLQASDDVTVTVVSPNLPPVVSAGADQTITFPTDTVTLAGSATDDGLPSGTTLSVTWSQVSGPAPVAFADAASAATTATFDAAGTYVLRLVATDSELVSSADTVVIVRAGNRAPVVSAGPAQTLGLSGGSVVTTLNGTASDDGLPAGGTLSVAWSRVSGPGVVSFTSPDQPSTTATFTVAGTYVLRFTASDTQLTSTSDVTITVQASVPNKAPVVSAGADQTVTMPGGSSLQGSVRDDGLPVGGSLSISWSKVSGPGSATFDDANAPRAAVAFGVPGTYVLRLTASDTFLTSTDDVTVTVVAPVDLLVKRVDASGIATDGQTLQVSGTIAADLTNVGVGGAGAFSVAFFEDRDGDGAYSAGVDTLLASAPAAGLAAGATTTISSEVNDSVLFRGNRIYALVDAGGQVAESNETNNLGFSTPPCTPGPTPKPFAARLEWAWTHSTVLPTALDVMSTPMVADLDGDGVPEIVFASFPVGSSVGFLRALHGRDGTEYFTVTNPAWAVQIQGQVAIGDIDGDGRPEIVALAAAPGQIGRLIAFEHDGTFKWLSANVLVDAQGGAPALADLDGDGRPEIVYGGRVLNGDGTLRWSVNAGQGVNNGGGPASLVADLDMDGRPEIVAGNTAYRADGSIYWFLSTGRDGFNAVGNFDSDPYPEVVLVALNGQASVWLLEHTGAIKWGPVALPGGGTGGPPAIADVDGDGVPEIAVAGTSRLTVLNANGTIRWSATTQDISSSRTTVAAYDFDGDGKAEIVYSDELKLRVYRGADGAVLFETDLGSGTILENPAIADVDGDGQAEIVGVANGGLGGSKHGIFVFGSANDDWTGARRIWNQHTYHVTNVNADLTIPAHETTVWSTLNGFRQQVYATSCPFPHAELTASYVRATPGAAGLALTARIGNGGELRVAAGQAVSFYDSAPAFGGRLLGMVPTQADLVPGAFEDATLVVPFGTAALPLWVTVGLDAKTGSPLDAYNSNLYLGASDNHPPVVDAGADQSLALPTDTVVLAGSVTDDGLPAGGALTSNWAQVSGAGRVTFTGTAPASTTATFEAGGIYTLRLMASDSQLTASDDVTVTVDVPGCVAPPAGMAAWWPADGTARDLVGGHHGALDGGVSFGGGRVGPAFVLDGTTGLVEVPDSPSLTPTSLTVDAWVKADALDDRAIVSKYDSTQGASWILRTLDSGRLRFGVYQNGTIFRGVDTDAPVLDFGVWHHVAGTFDAATQGVRIYADGAEVPATLWPGSATVSAISDSATPVRIGTYVDGGSLLGFWQGAIDEVELFGRALDGAEVQALAAAGGAGQCKTLGNQPPQVNAGPDQTITLPTSAVTLNGSASDDGRPAGSTLNVAWSQIAGPSPVTFGSPAQAVATASFGRPGVYVLRLTADDSELTTSANVTVTLKSPGPPNQAPVVSAGPGQSTALPNARVTLAGSATDDGLPAGSPLTYAWSVVEGEGRVDFSAPDQAVTDASFPIAGAYRLRLTASDGELTGSADVWIAVAPAPNAAPQVSAGADQTITLPTTTTTLVGAVSDDGFPIGSALSVAWSQVGGPEPVIFGTPTTATTTVAFAAAGVYLLRLAATDGVLSSTADVTVTVNPAAPAGNAPTVQIASPADGSVITTRVDVIGTIDSANLLGWKLEYRLTDDAKMTTFASGNKTVSGGVIATFDPTLLLNGTYEVRLTARDMANRAQTTAFTAVVRDNQKVGNFTVSFVDLEVPVAGLPIRVTRTYDSRDKRVGEFGVGWRLDLANVRVSQNRTLGDNWTGTFQPGFANSYCLSETLAHIVTVTFADGRVYEFEPQLQPQCQTFVPITASRVGYKARPGTLGTLELAEGVDVLVEASWPGPARLLAFDGQPFRPTRFRYTSPDGRVFLLGANGLESVTDLNGNTLTVTANGMTHSSGRGVVFTRDAQNRITTITDPAGEKLSYAYDVAGDLASFTDRENATTKYSYNQTHGLLKIEDPRGIEPIRNEYDASGRLLRHTDAFGRTIEYTHDLNARQEVVTDRLGNVRVLEYDERGNVVKETDPTGRVTRRSFDSHNNRTSETDARGKTTLYAYDGNDNLLSVKDPLSNETKYTYNARKQVLTVTDPRGKVTTNSYDANGNLLSTTDAQNHVTSSTYDSKGNVLTQTDAQGKVTQYAYDGTGNLTKETDAKGHETTYTNHVNGYRLSQTTTRTVGGTTETLTTTYSYDRQGRLLQTTDPDGSTTRTVYDSIGKPGETFDKLGRRTSYTYDDMGRLTKTTHPDGTSEASTYDAEGHRLSSTDRGGHVTTYQYDLLGRLVKATYADGYFTTSSYDDAGRLAQTNDSLSSRMTYGYDDAGRRTTVADAFSQTTTFGYDGNGNQTSVKDARGNTTSYEYDELNRRTKTIFPDASFTQTTYDTLGRRIAETDQAGKTTRFDYDELGRLLKVTDALNQVTSYGYDEAGSRISQTDANGHVTQFEYDSLGRQTKRILPDGKSETMQYDSAGNLSGKTDFAGRTIGYTYDESNRLLRKDLPDGTAVAYSYTPTGRRASVTDSRGTTAYGYDARDRLQSLLYPDGRSLAYTWDGEGNPKTLMATIGTRTLKTTYVYDVLRHLRDVLDPLNRDYNLGYDANGNRSSRQDPNVVRTDYTYDKLNRLTNLTSKHVISGRLIQSYAFVLGASGNRTQITEGDGTVRQYTYDDLYRLTSERVTVNNLLDYEKAFTYDPVGNRQTQATTGNGALGTPTAPGTINYTYDERDRLTSTVILSEAKNLAYDDNGNLVTKTGEASYTWDAENRLINVTKADSTTITNVYDADGNRVQTTTTLPAQPAQVVNYLIDTSGGLSHVVAETDGTGALKELYIRGDGELLSVMRPTGTTTWSTRYVHADGLGSIRRLTDENALITDGYTYSAFGELLAHTGKDPQPYTFAGEPSDPNIGWSYNRARWMDPSVGRFVGMDPFGGVSADPTTLHRYLYAGGNPVNSIDPTGHFELSVGGLLGNISIANVIRSMAIGYGVGTIIGAADAYLAGSDPDGIQEAAIKGGLLGSVTGGLFLVKFLQPVLLLGGNALAVVGVADALESDNYQLAGFRATLFLVGAVAYFRSIPEPELPTGRLGNQATRDHIREVVQVMRDRGWKLKAGGGQLPEEYLPGPGPGTKGGNFIDITMEKNGRTLRVNTVDTYADGVTPTRREAAAAALIRSKTGPGEHLLLIPKPK